MSKLRCAIYDRVSTELQVQSGLSLDAQKQMLTDYAASHGYEIVGYYADEGITARKKMQNRHDFMRLLADVQQNKIDLILVTKLDRWFRNVRDYHNTQAILEQHGCNWKTILEDYDTSTADGQLKINIMLAVAQNECDRTSERIKTVFQYKLRKREHLNGRAPYGYCIKDKYLEKDEKTQPIVEDIFRFYGSHYSKLKTIEYIQEKYKDESPTVYQINRIITSDVYAGIQHGIPGYCEPYITQEQLQLFTSVCSTKTYKSSREPYLFSQLMKCPYCSATMTGFVKRQKLKNGTYSEYKRYRCSRKYSPHETGVCISESTLEAYMLQNIYTVLQNDIYRLRNQAARPSQNDNSCKFRSEMERLNVLYQKGRISDNYYNEQYVSLEKKLAAEIEKNKLISVEDYHPIQRQLTGNWQNIYDKLDIEHKRSFWKSIIREIYLEKETHKISGFSFLI